MYIFFKHPNSMIMFRIYATAIHEMFGFFSEYVGENK